MQLFDDDLDGKLGRSELDRFFQIFNSDDDKLIDWNEFLFHASKLMRERQEHQATREEAKQHVPTREELKQDAERRGEHEQRERRRGLRRSKSGSVEQHAKARPSSAKAPSKGSESMPTLPRGDNSFSSSRPLGERSRGAKAGMA